MIKPIFKNNALQEQFDEQGYVVIPLLDKSDIQQLTDIFHSFHKDIPPNAFQSSSYLKDKATKEAIRNLTYEIFLPRIQEVFKDFTYFGSAYLFKSSGENSDVSAHQDWTIVDESKAVAINIWTPLIDTNVNNGTLSVVPGSQSNKVFSLRAPTIPFYFQEYYDSVLKCCVPLEVKAGEAVVLNQSLIHYSSPNLSGKLRIAITSGIKTKDEPMVFHFKNEKNQIERYEMPEDFLIAFEDFDRNIYERPAMGKLLNDNVADQMEYISKKEFLQRFGQKKNGGLVSFLSSLFSR